ncbi:hypothetical protein DH2020_012586 [Rehmannia glutinosa]|uniref:Cysteine protease n=1 Tax=Rehmannia glutinosa TaxID=99300 RepID=A0ABR0WZT4_REHGL
MKGFRESNSDPIHNSSNKKLNFDNSPKKIPGSVSPEAEPSIGYSKHQTSWGIWTPSISIFGSLSGSHKSELKNCCNSSSIRKKSTSGRSYYEGWRAAVRRVMMNGGSMRRILGFNRTSTPASKSDIWLLGVCYQVAHEGEDSSNPTQSEGFAAFVEDFSSRILITYRKVDDQLSEIEVVDDGVHNEVLSVLVGFSPIGDTKYSSDVNWGCMLRSSQMLVAQALHQLDQNYIEILHLFGDSEDSPCSIHNLLQAGKAYGLAPGSWVGPYAMCRTWESLLRNKREETDSGVLSSMMALYVVSGDEDGERGGAPVLCIEDISTHCSEFGGGQVDWAPILLMVPLVLGLEKVNPRPGASTYIVGVQDEKAFYLDPHEVQQVHAISFLEVSQYALKWKLIDRSNGAPLFTIAETRSSPRPSNDHTAFGDNATGTQDYDIVHRMATGESEDCAQEDDWQLL